MKIIWIDLALPLSHADQGQQRAGLEYLSAQPRPYSGRPSKHGACKKLFAQTFKFFEQLL